MKANAIIRIIIWSLVLVILVGLLVAGLLLRHRQASFEAPVETVLAVAEAPVPFTEYPWEVRTASCDVDASVTATGLNVRSAPTSDSSIVGMLEKGDVVSIDQGVEIGNQSEHWLHIYAPVDGWIKAEFVDSLEGVEFYGSEALRSWTDAASEPAGKSVTASAIVTVFSAPTTTSAAVGQIDAGDAVTVSRQENVNGEAWAYITAPSSGWVQAAFLMENAPEPSAAADNADISLDPKQIQEIDIEWAAGNIIVEAADVDTIRVTETASGNSRHAMVWKESNHKLTIRFSEQNVFSFGIDLGADQAKDLTIQVPMGWECSSLDIDAASATVGVKNLTIREVDFDGASGICTFDNCAVDELDIDTASGDIYFTGTLNALECDAASASVYAVFDNVPGRIEMDSMSGDLDITLPSTAGFTVSLNALSSDFACDFGYSQQKDNTYRRGDGKCRISLNAMSGDLYIREYRETEAVPEST